MEQTCRERGGGCLVQFDYAEFCISVYHALCEIFIVASDNPGVYCIFVEVAWYPDVTVVVKEVCVQYLLYWQMKVYDGIQCLFLKISH